MRNFGFSSPAGAPAVAIEGVVLPPLPLPRVATYRREDFDLPLVCTACVSLADCAGD